MSVEQERRDKLLGRIAPVMNGGVPEGEAWHRRLLDNMAMGIPDLRPAVLRATTAQALDVFAVFLDSLTAP